MSKQNKQPLLQHPAVVGVLASLLSIVIGLVLGFVLLVLLNPSASVGGMKAMLTTGFSNMDKLGKVLYQAAPLMMCGLSVGFAFKTGLFNIGASGQYTMGAFFSLLCAIQFQMPWYVCLLAGAVGGAIWGVFPGLFKAYFNVNEVITAIMFNWIGMYLVNLLLANMPNMLASGWGASNSDRTAALSAANPGSILPKGPFAALFGNSSWINISIIITILFAILVWVILQKTTFGYELKACGLSRDAAQYAGINSKRNIVLSMVISGALSGIGGAIYYLAGTGQVVDGAANAGQRTGNDHGKHDVTLGIDTRILGGITAEAAGFQLIAESRLLQDDPDEDGKKNRDNDGNVDPAGIAEQRGKRPLGQDRPWVGSAQRGGTVRVGRAPAGSQHIGHIRQQQVHQIHTDPVEHDGGDDLIDVEIRLEQARENAPDGTAHSARQQADVPRHLELNGAQQREKCTHGVLTGSADVEQAGLEGKADGQAAHHQRRCLIQHLAQLVHVGKTSGQHGFHAAHGCRGIQQDQQHKAQHQTDDDGQKACQHAYYSGVLQKRLFILFTHAFASPCFFAPAIYRPNSSTVVLRGSNSPTISPS